MAFLLDENNDVIDIVEDYDSLRWSRNFLKPGAFQMVINRNSRTADKLEKGKLILPTEVIEDVDQVYLIEQIESVIDEEGKQNENLILTGRSIGGMFEERLALPDTTDDPNDPYDTRLGSAETLMKFWVDYNAGSQADINRQIPNFEIEPDQARGEDVNYKVRYQKVSEMLEDVSRAGGIGWQTFYDIEDQASRFDVIIPTDRTKGSANPVFLDIDFETILAMNLIETDMEKKSFAIVGGAGEGTDRIIEETYIADIEPEGLERREIFVDAGGLDDPDNVIRSGNVELLKREQETLIEVDVNHFGSFKYLKDWFVGDVVTIRNEDWNFERDIQIIGVTIEVRANEGRPLIDVQLGQEFPTVKNQVELELGEDERERS